MVFGSKATSLQMMASTVSWAPYHSYCQKKRKIQKYYLGQDFILFLLLKDIPFFFFSQIRRGGLWHLLCSYVLAGRKSGIWEPLIHNLLPSAICLWDSFPVLPEGSGVIIHDPVIFSMASGTVSKFFVLFGQNCHSSLNNPSFFFSRTLTHRIIDSQGWKEAERSSHPTPY